MAANRHIAFLLLIISVISQRIADGVVITNLRVPEKVVNGSTDSIVLDCDYELEGDSTGLVVKWFFNNNPDPVYQWIHRNRPQDLGVLRGKVNLNYIASPEDTGRHRALEIIKPTTQLSGEYKCLVSTFQGEDSLSKKMVIYVPEKSLTMTVLNKDARVTVRCVAEGVYPEPKLTITAKDKGHETSSEREESVIAERPTRRLRVSTAQPVIEVVSKQNVYDIVAEVTYKDEDLESPTTFDCQLKIPEANYSVSKSTIYYPERNAAVRLWSLASFSYVSLGAIIAVSTYLRHSY